MIYKNGIKSLSKLHIFILILIILSPALILSQTESKQNNPDPERFAQDIEMFINWDRKNAVPDNPVLFVGSSSIRMWTTREFFPDYPVINRGFGGSHISDVNYYIKDIVLKYKPRSIIFYAGDNDIAGGKNPQQVLEDYISFVSTVKENLPDTRIIFIPIKPSIARWNLWPEMEKTNTLIKNYSQKNSFLYYADTATPMLGIDGKPKVDLFLDDGLHLTKKGYVLWTGILTLYLENTLK